MAAFQSNMVAFQLLVAWIAVCNVYLHPPHPPLPKCKRALTPAPQKYQLGEDPVNRVK